MYLTSFSLLPLLPLFFKDMEISSPEGEPWTVSGLWLSSCREGGEGVVYHHGD